MNLRQQGTWHIMWNLGASQLRGVLEKTYRTWVYVR